MISYTATSAFLKKYRIQVIQSLLSCTRYFCWCELVFPADSLGLFKLAWVEFPTCESAVKCQKSSTTTGEHTWVRFSVQTVTDARQCLLCPEDGKFHTLGVQSRKNEMSSVMCRRYLNCLKHISKVIRAKMSVMWYLQCTQTTTRWCQRLKYIHLINRIP